MDDKIVMMVTIVIMTRGTFRLWKEKQSADDQTVSIRMMGRGSRGGLLPSVRGRPSLVSNGIGRGIMPGLYMVVIIIIGDHARFVDPYQRNHARFVYVLKFLRCWGHASIVHQLHVCDNIIRSLSNNNLAISRNVSSPRNDLSFWSWYFVFAGACLTNQVTIKDGGLLLWE